MAKFLMAIDERGIPVSINTDMIIAIEDSGDDKCWVITTKWNYTLIEPYSQIVKKLTPFIPIEDLSQNTKESEWLAKYLESIKEVNNADNNNG